MAFGTAAFRANDMMSSYGARHNREGIHVCYTELASENCVLCEPPFHLQLHVRKGLTAKVGMSTSKGALRSYKLVQIPTICR